MQKRLKFEFKIERKFLKFLNGRSTFVITPYTFCQLLSTNAKVSVYFCSNIVLIGWWVSLKLKIGHI